MRVFTVSEFFVSEPGQYRDVKYSVSAAYPVFSVYVIPPGWLARMFIALG